METRCAGIGVTLSKMLFICENVGVVPNMKQLGINIRVVDNNEVSLNEVKRCGLVIDRNCTLEMKLGD